MKLRLSAATEDLSRSLKKSIGIAATCELDGVRLNTRSELDVTSATDSALRQTLLYVRERQMRVAGLYCPTRHALYDPDYLEPRLDVIRKSMAMTRKLETGELLVRCGRIPDPDADETKTSPPVTIDQQANPFSFAPGSPPQTSTAASRFALLCELLNDLAQYGNHVGCVLNLIPSGYNQKLIHRLLSAIKTGPVKIAFDPATAVMTGCNVVQTYRDLYQEIGTIRARDAISDIDGAGIEVAVGDGTVDWIHLLPTLVDADYENWICVERTGGDDRKTDVIEGVSHLKKLLPQTDG